MFFYVPWFSPLPVEKVFAIFGSLMAIVEALDGLGVAFASNPTENKQEAVHTYSLPPSCLGRTFEFYYSRT